MTTNGALWAAAVVAFAWSAGCSGTDGAGDDSQGGGGVLPPPTGTVGGAGLGATSGGSAAPVAAPSGTAGVGSGLAGGGDSAAGPAGSPGLGAGGLDMMGAAGTGVDMGTAGSGVATQPTPHGDSTCLQAGNGDYTNPGPYQVGMMDVDLGMVDPGQGTGMYTIFYPMPLEQSCLHPIVAWGNGTGVTGSDVYAFLNQNAASWGIVVAAAQDSNTGSGLFHKAGLDWLLKQNEDAGSMFFHKLSTRAGVSGHSQGGIGANAGSSHPNVETAAIEGMSMVATSKVSVLVLTGTMDIVMNVEASVPSAQGPMFVANWEGGDHFTTETLGGYIAGDKGSLQFQRLYAAWFRCFLADDAVACAKFGGGTPSNCGICKDPGWHALASNIM